MIALANRIHSLPPYIFSEISRIRLDAEKRGVQLISLAVGDPDQPTPEPIVERIQAAAARITNHTYSSYDGSADFRKAAAAWMADRFGVDLDGEKQVIALIGSKEGIAHFPMAFCNPGDRILYPSPGYPVFQNAILLAGGIPIALPHRGENGFLPKPAELEALLRQHKPKFMILNYPSNPTTAVCPPALLTQIVDMAKRHGTYLAYDNAYSEIYFDREQRPMSLLEIPGAMNISIEFHSLSKTFNMTGWRLGFAVGNETLIKGLLSVKTNIDSGPLLAVQEAGVFALQHADTFTAPLRHLYQERRDLALKCLQQLGVEYFVPQATFFVWARVPKSMGSMAFCKHLIEKQGLVVTPGIGFGSHGEHFFRLSLTLGKKEMEEAFKRLEAGLRAI